ncbi:DUF3418 domain-containing protein [Pseudactinotalea sp. Z1739]|uniref:DUF3418 domain-containing protein n=1 Tax=Pseudactinotalea sp. Z1739 TaxID=3413028 RepID=UPI003C7E9B66
MTETKHNQRRPERGSRRRRPQRRREGYRKPDPQLLQRRRDAVPKVAYPEQLPVSARREEIAEAIEKNQVVILSGETGSGKTTQLPKICLDLGRGIEGTVGHTQPRRIAARTVAERIAEELGTEVGQAVGYQVRFTDQVSETTLIKVMTDGILLAEVQRDPMLRRYDTIIVDEAHERSLNIDFLLGYLHQLLPQRPDLKVIITSATIDSERFAEHFGSPGTPAPVIEVSGRTYPVEVRYRPLVQDTETTEDDDEAPGRAGGTGAGTGAGDPARSRGSAGPTRSRGNSGEREPLDQATAICLAADELMAEGPGDILVFCSGEREIRDGAESLTNHLSGRPGPEVEILPLYARLSAADQHRVFAAHSNRRIVLATNIAETSLTVPGIRYVIDPGTARISRYSKGTKVQRLPIEPVSQASADQRAGRCGRVADGICIRLYSKADYESRPEFTEPEILRTSLASVILQMTALGLGEVAKFGFVDPPDTRSVRDGVALLTELGAITDDDGARPARPGPADAARPGELHPTAAKTARRDASSSATPGLRLTKVGRSLAHLPIDPRLGRMLLEADRLGVAAEVLVIVAALSIQDVRERPPDARQQADAKHRRFAEETSDFLSILRLWDYLRTKRAELSSSAFRRMCRAEYLHFLRIREWQDVHTQLRQMIKPLGIHLGRLKAPGDVDADAVHQAMLTGLLTQIGSWDERKRDYLGARGARFVIFPGSHLAKKRPDWVMAAELVETSRLFARTAARIRPEWVEPLAAHLIKRSYSEPYWSTRQGAGMVKEKVMLYGLTLVADRPVPYARVDAPAAREMFIRHALVDGEWRTHHAFVEHNAGVIAEAEELQARERRRDLMLDEDGLFDFYDERIPEHVVTAAHFDTWWKQARREHPDLLNLSVDLLVPQVQELDPGRYPQVWQQGDLTLPLSYQFEPGTEADGVTVHIPIAVLGRVRPEGFDWLVPGLLQELTVASIKALPKPIRKHLVPAPDTARAIAELLPPWEQMAPAGEGAVSFAEAFATAARQVRPELEISAGDRDPEKLPPHLRITFQVHAERGAVLGTGQHLEALQRELSRQSGDAVRTAVKSALLAARKRAGSPAAGPGTAEVASAGAGAAGAGAASAGAGSAEDGDGDGDGDRATSPQGGVRAGLAEEKNLTGWPAMDRIPDVVTATGAGGLEIRGYPALVVEGEATGRVSLRVLQDAAAQSGAHRAGVRRLLADTTALPTGRVSSRWGGREALSLAASPYRDTAALVTGLHRAAVASLTASRDLAQVRTAEAFAQVEADVRARLEDEIYRLAALTVQILDASRELQAQIKATTSMALLDVLTDVRDQHAALIHDRFLTTTPPEQLMHLPRYLQAATMRLAKAAENPNRDADLAWQIRDLHDAWWAADRATTDPAHAEQLAQVRWMLEELRVSFFAQQLGTAVPVSAKRIRKALAEVGSA